MTSLKRELALGIEQLAHGRYHTYDHTNLMQLAEDVSRSGWQRLRDLQKMRNRIIINARICHGKPVIRGTRTPVSLIIGSLADGMTFEEVEREYSVTKDDIRAALQFASELVAQTQAPAPRQHAGAPLGNRPRPQPLMAVSVTVSLTTPAQAKHRQQLRQAAAYLSPVKSSIRVSQPAGNPKQLTARFMVPKARQIDVVDRIGRQFWNVEDYSDETISFGP